MGLRRVTPDNSVLIASYFQETVTQRGSSFDRTRRARPIRDAIEGGAVAAFAPEQLRAEFLGVCFDKIHGRGRAPDDEAVVVAAVEGFFRLPITFVPGIRIAEEAWRLARSLVIAPDDSMYLACAIHARAELWLSHQHRDDFAEKARSVYAPVHLLTEERFFQ